MLSNSRASALKPGSPVSVFTTPLSELALGSGVVHKVATDGTVEVHLDWNLADGRPACLYSQANCLRLDDRVTTPGAEVAVFSSAAQSSRSAKPTQVFTRGVVAGVVRNPDMVKVNLQWNLADGAPASLFTPAANLQLVADVEAAQAEAEARSKRMALARHAAQFKARTKVIVLSTPSSTPPGSDSERPVLSWGTVSRNRFANKTCIVDLPWKLADGTSAKLFAASSNLRLPNREESLRHAASLKDEGGVQFSKKEYFTALQIYVNSLEFIQQWIVRNRTEPAASLMDFFAVQQKLFGNIAWCMFNRDSFEKSVQFCTRVLGMFDDAPDGKLPDDVGMRAKYLYLRSRAHLANVASRTHLRDARKDCEVGQQLEGSPLGPKFSKQLKKIAAVEARQKEKKANFARRLASGGKKTSADVTSASSSKVPKASSKAKSKSKSKSKSDSKKSTKKSLKKTTQSKSMPAASSSAARPTTGSSSTPSAEPTISKKSVTSPDAQKAKDKKDKKKSRKSKKGSRKSKQKSGLPGWVAPVVAAGLVATGLAVFFGSKNKDSSSQALSR